MLEFFVWLILLGFAFSFTLDPKTHSFHMSPLLFLQKRETEAEDRLTGDICVWRER